MLSVTKPVWIRERKDEPYMMSHTSNDGANDGTNKWPQLQRCIRTIKD
jgi:hypothetical protein